jgi:hypothetical protein
MVIFMGFQHINMIYKDERQAIRSSIHRICSWILGIRLPHSRNWHKNNFAQNKKRIIFARDFGRLAQLVPRQIGTGAATALCCLKYNFSGD